MRQFYIGPCMSSEALRGLPNIYRSAYTPTPFRIAATDATYPINLSLFRILIFRQKWTDSCCRSRYLAWLLNFDWVFDSSHRLLLACQNCHWTWIKKLWQETSCDHEHTVQLLRFWRYFDTIPHGVGWLSCAGFVFGMFVTLAQCYCKIHGFHDIFEVCLAWICHSFLLFCRRGSLCDWESCPQWYKDSKSLACKRMTNAVHHSQILVRHDWWACPPYLYW